jgi:hypothetical protein
MANSISSDLIQDIVVETFNAVATKRIGGFKDCVSDFSADAVAILQNGKPTTAQISLDEGAGATKENPTTFEDASNTIVAKAIPVSLLSQQFGLAWDSGLKLESIIESNANALCDAMIAKFVAVLKQATGEVSVDIAGAKDGDAKDNLFQEIFASLDKGNKKILYGNSSLYSKGAPVNRNSFDLGGSVRGFDGFYELSYINSEDFAGVVTDGRGVGIISRLPEWTGAVNQLLSQSVINVDKLGLSVQFNTWASASSRSTFGSMDVVFGCGKYDMSATKKIVQA